MSSSVTTVDDEVARLEQALLDLSHARASSVSLTEVGVAVSEAALVRALTKAAESRGFVVAHVPLADTPLDALEGLLTRSLDALAVPGVRDKGLLGLLAAYYDRHGSKAVARFDEAVEEEQAEGDLAAICRAYLGAEGDAAREVRAFTLWAEGTDLSARTRIDGVRSKLDAHSAQRVLRDLSRVVRALGYPGTLLLLSGGTALTERTERQRERGYTVLRELVDNFDSGRGVAALRISILGGPKLFSGPHSVQSLPPLAMRLAVPSGAEPPPPHRAWTALVKEPFEYVHRRVRAPRDVKPSALRSFIRVAQGLPPTEAVASMSVGHERIDRTVDKLLGHAENAGSVFQVLSGEYGSGKTHVLLHLAERAHKRGHPIFWLNLERMNLDLGNPARHLSRVLETSVLPVRGRPTALDRLAQWTRSKAKSKALTEALSVVAASDSEESAAAKKALALAAAAEDPGMALEEFLSARDLASKPNGPSYRHDAYRRLLLWCALLTNLEKAKGPVILIDEAENLYTTGVSRPSRRAALRTLSFLCGGAVPGACVILAMTPSALAEMRKESAALLGEQEETESTLTLEDVTLFRRRLSKLVPDEVPDFSRPMRLALAERVRSTHELVRGSVDVGDWEGVVRAAVNAGGPPRTLVRHLADQLEAAWWRG